MSKFIAWYWTLDVDERDGEAFHGGAWIHISDPRNLEGATNVLVDVAVTRCIVYDRKPGIPSVLPSQRGAGVICGVARTLTRMGKTSSGYDDNISRGNFDEGIQTRHYPGYGWLMVHWQ
jgi:hypothetical protein